MPRKSSHTNDSLTKGGGKETVENNSGLPRTRQCSGIYHLQTHSHHSNQTGDFMNTVTEAHKRENEMVSQANFSSLLQFAGPYSQPQHGELFLFKQALPGSHCPWISVVQSLSAVSMSFHSPRGRCPSLALH